MLWNISRLTTAIESASVLKGDSPSCCFMTRTERGDTLRAGVIGVSARVFEKLLRGDNPVDKFDIQRFLCANFSGGIAEGIGIAAIAPAWRMPLNAHRWATGINHAATLHSLAATEIAGYFESCVPAFNPLHDMFGKTYGRSRRLRRALGRARTRTQG
jgi:hypothetical protein